MEMNEDITGGIGDSYGDEIPQNILPNLPENAPIILIGIFLLIGAMRFLIRFFQYKYMEKYKETLDRRLKKYLGLRTYYYGKYFK